jgi:hypothetical protein
VRYQFCLPGTQEDLDAVYSGLEGMGGGGSQGQKGLQAANVTPV